MASSGPIMASPVRHMARMILLAAAAAALLAAAPARAALQPTLGTLCGPNDDGIWIKPDKLVASGGGKVGADGCITADTKSATPFVRADLGDLTYTLFDVYIAASASSSKRNASLYFGDVDLSKWPKVSKNAVLKNEGMCASLPLKGEQRFTCDFSWKGAGSTGSLFSVVAPGAKVCGLMLCVKEKLFSDNGEALSPMAAALYDTVVASLQGNGQAIQQRAAAAAELAAAGLPGTCAGYQSQKYGSCPNGTVCASTYKPGDDHCNCWHCSAFSKVPECNQGDLQIGAYDCCFTCPDQRICAVCKPPCNDEVTSVEVVPGTMPTTPNSYTPATGKIDASTLAQNYGANPQSVSVSFAFSQQMQASMKWGKKFAFSEKASVKVGVPFLAESGSLEFSASQEMSEEKTTTTTRTITITYQLSEQIPAFTAQEVNATADLGMVEVTIPVTVKTTSTCNGVKEEANSITVQSSGVMDTAHSKLSITYGKQIPLDPPIVLDQANATCDSNPVCRTMGLTTGNCCPDPAGKFNPCCAFCKAKTACAAFAEADNTMCCPTRSNIFNPCCSKDKLTP